jgi:zinc D-Ala-D-Ala carboxypeptidase
MLRNFSLGEFTQSDTAKSKGIANTLPAGMEATALNTLEMMQRIRDHLSALKGRDVPITITSGFRSPALNRAVGGVASSDHVAACAVDFKAPQFGTPIEVARALAPYVNELGIGQLINEHPEKGSAGWVHVSTRKQTLSANRIITITAKGTTSGVNQA